jgi:hypothetical protein
MTHEYILLIARAHDEHACWLKARGLSRREIGLRMGISVGRVAARFARVKKRRQREQVSRGGGQVAHHG